MVRIEPRAWRAMVSAAESAYPLECCGAMFGRKEGDAKTVTLAVPLENVFPGERRNRYAIRPEDLLLEQSRARDEGLDLIGIYHSHPDAPAYFSSTDLENCWPWHSFVVLSVRDGRFDHAACFLPDRTCTEAAPEELAAPGD